jgi:hypothetical protein
MGYVRGLPTTRFDADGHQDVDKKSGVPGLKYQPSIGEAVEVKAGVCLCAGGSVNAGPVKVNASAEIIGAEVSTTLAGSVDAKVSVANVEGGAKVGPVGAQVGAGTQLSSKDGLTASGQATINGAGVQADTKNGVSAVVQGSHDHDVQGTAKLGVVKGSIAVSPSVIGKIYDAMKTNIPIIVGSMLDHVMPGWGTPNVGQPLPRVAKILGLATAPLFHEWTSMNLINLTSCWNCRMIDAGITNLICTHKAKNGD